MRQLAGDRAIRASTLFLVISCVLVVLDLALPSDPVKAASGPAILVAVIGAVAARAL